MSTIPNYGGMTNTPKSRSDGEIRALHIKKLFRMIILSPSGGGKTNLLYHILKSSPNVYSHLHVIARNPDQPLYNDLKEKLSEFIAFHDPDEIPPVNAICHNKNDLPEMVVFDDLSSERILQKNVISQYFYRGRHQRLTMIMCAHAFFHLDKMIRLNSEYCFILKANAKRDLQMILKDFNIPITESNFYEVYRRATEHKRQRNAC
ncbi:hypothetical protein PybrP1_000604 [[Pythium] brassicae (nom. inval.)]|nr:hypothetical protein PybrP1_000604 [[Pythium] brassicae (nom. inval.)]